MATRSAPLPDSPPPSPQAGNEPAETGTSLSRDAWHRLRKNRLAVISGAFFVLLSLASLFALPIHIRWATDRVVDAEGAEVTPERVLVDFTLPGFYPFSPIEISLSRGATPPRERIVRVDEVGRREPRLTTLPRLADANAVTPERVRVNRRPRPITDEERATLLAALDAGTPHTIGDSTYTPIGRPHLLGTDQLGRDLLARIFAGARVSLGVGFLATLVSVVIGVLWGAIAAYKGGKTDIVMMRIVDILYGLPFTIFVILLMVIFGRSLALLFVAIGCVEWLTMARIVRAQALSVMRMEYIEAARALGLSNRRIILRHIIPNILGPVIVFATLTVPAVMLLESALSFLGLGVQPPMSSLGGLIKEGAEAMQVFPWLLIYPAATFSLTIFSLNFLGDGLRDALDVKASKD